MSPKHNPCLDAPVHVSSTWTPPRVVSWKTPVLVSPQDVKDYMRRRQIDKGIQADDEDEELLDEFVDTPWGRRKSVIM